MWKMQGDAVNDKRLEKHVNCIADSTGFQASAYMSICLKASYYEF